ncbi:unnamed protein product [Closterium sp. NIES-53]
MKPKARLLGRSGSKKRLVVPPSPAPVVAAEGGMDEGKAEERRKEAEREEGRERERGLLGVIEADKYAIMRRCSIPARDLRILDPLLSYPSTLLGREQAIVVNLEHIKCIIMAEEVLLLNWRNFQVARVVEELKARLPLHLNAGGQQALAGGAGGGVEELKARLPLHLHTAGHQVGGWLLLQGTSMSLSHCTTQHCTAHLSALPGGGGGGVEELKARLPLHFHTHSRPPGSKATNCGEGSSYKVCVCMFPFVPLLSTSGSAALPGGQGGWVGGWVEGERVGR